VRLPGGGSLPFKVFLERLYLAQDDHAAFDTAAQLSYYLILSLFPLLFILTALLAYLPLGDAQAHLIDRMRSLVPPEAMTIVEVRLASLLTTQRPSLLGLGVVLALWAASCGVDSARKALNLAYDVKESRPFWKTQLIAIASTVISSVFVLLAVGVLIATGVAGHWLAARLGVDRAFTLGLGVIRWPLTAALMMLGTAGAFHLLPDVRQKFAFMLPGAVIGTLLWLGASWVFTQYVRHFGRYDVTYGAIGGVVVLLTWLYISGFIFVIGGEINAILEHAAVDGKEDGARDEGEGAPPPSQRPSFLPPGAVKNATVAARAPASPKPPHDFRLDVGASPPPCR
jgi:membrane protein